jgi:hypothetical protein
MKRILFITGAGLALAASSCKVDKGKMLINTWKMAEDSSVVFQFNADSTYSSQEGDLRQTGEWDVTPDMQWLILKNDKTDKGNKQQVQIKTLTHQKLVLFIGGEDLVFVDSQ